MKPLMKGLLPALLTLALQPALAQAPPAPKDKDEEQKLETVTVTALITDYTPQPEFFLLQRREGPVAALPARRREG